MDRAPVHTYGVLDNMVAGCTARKMDEALLLSGYLETVAINEP